jgi:hypothetical protein
MHSEEMRKVFRYLMLNLRKRTLKLVRTNMPHLSLAVILDDNVMHDHTSLHHLPHLIMRLRQSRIPNNSKLNLKHTKCPLNVLSVALLMLDTLQTYL